ncbi:MAG: Abi family protein [Pyrinomonadaceae bacterium]
MDYSKPSLNVQDQIALLKKRGLKINNDEDAERYLLSINYYRLTGYFDSFRNANQEEFFPDTSFEQILNLYHFDRELKLLVFSAIERIEIAFRTQMAYSPTLECGPNWYENPENFYNFDKFETQMDLLIKELEKSKEEFLDHFYSKYADDFPPAWITFEAISLGLLTNIYSNMHAKFNSKRLISKHFGIDDPVELQSWLFCILAVRNICAHHGRFWNREFEVLPQDLKRPLERWISTSPKKNKAYYIICCLFYMLRNVEPKTTFAEKLSNLLRKYPTISRANMGFGKNWDLDEFWDPVCSF